MVIAVAPIGEKTAELLPVQIVEVGGGFGGQATDLVTSNRVISFGVTIT
jgi:hypothetical protein